ncbi:hypothetical protein KC901_00570 [Patescibacteria group bacterium]|nr:hypothetical protein [Patescibacteria group bacterium]
MEWLTQQIITLTPLALFVLLLAAMCVGWIVYGLRGYHHWFKRFHRYRILPERRRMKPYYGYVEYIPEVMKSPVSIAQPVARPPHIINKTQAPVAPKYSTKDDLQVIEGIGPKTEEVLNEHGIHTWRELAQTPLQNIRNILERAGLTLQDPTTWNQQAHMAYMGQWGELRNYQDILTRGK